MGSPTGKVLTILSQCHSCHSTKNIQKEQHNALPNGIIALKGGELDREMASMRNICTAWDISDYFSEEYFETKKIVHVIVKA